MNSIHNLVDTEYCASIIQILSETFQSFKKVEVTSHIFFQSHNYPSHHFKLLLPQFSPKLVWRQICSIFNHLSPSESQKSVCLWRFCLWQKCLWRKMSTFQCDLSAIGAKWDIENTPKCTCLTVSLPHDSVRRLWPSSANIQDVFCLYEKCENAAMSSSPTSGWRRQDICARFCVKYGDFVFRKLLPFTSFAAIDFFTWRILLKELHWYLQIECFPLRKNFFYIPPSQVPNGSNLVKKWQTQIFSIIGP